MGGDNSPDKTIEGVKIFLKNIIIKMTFYLTYLEMKKIKDKIKTSTSIKILYQLFILTQLFLMRKLL